MKNTLAEWLKWQESLHAKEIDLGLDRIYKVAKNLDLLSPAFPIITVAGTNGKGSSVAILDSIYKAQGYNTGNYTSPHLLTYNERIKLNGVSVSDRTIVNAFEQIDHARGDITLSYFEFGTLASLLIFTQQNVDVAILEVGLGGRLDAANLWDASLAIITSIDIDHTDWLGDNREVIGIEKSGIMRPNTPVICGDPNPPESISNEAKKIGADLYQYQKTFSYKKQNVDYWIWLGEINKHSLQYTLPYPALAGDFQLNNASTVIAGIKAIEHLLEVSDNAIKLGLASASIPGRLQIIRKKPEWILDVAHNPHAAKELANYLKKHPPKGKTYAIFSMLKDKDISKVLLILDKFIDNWHIIGLEGSRGLSVKELKQYFSSLNIRGDVTSHENFSDACYFLKNISYFEDRVVAFGSFLVVSTVTKNCNL